MDDKAIILFVGSVFFTVFLLSQVLILPTFGTDSKQRKKLKQRFDKLLMGRQDTHQQLLKKKYLDQLNPLGRWLESKPAMMKLKLFLEQAGSQMPAYHFMLWDILFGASAAILTWVFFHEAIAALMALLIAMYLPFFRMGKKRDKNHQLIEEQLPEALEMMARSMRTGYPFNESLKIVAEEMAAPIGYEFGLVFEEINYGRDLETALAVMIERVPSLSLSAMATSILIQKETGGNLSEILLKISDVLRARFKLQRRVKTLSAEGIFTAWVLCLLPFVMFLMFNLINPGHFDALYEHPKGVYLFYGIAFLETVAIFWIKNIVDIDV